MSRRQLLKPARAERFPRVSGDEPGGLEIDGIPGPFSPRERG